MGLFGFRSLASRQVAQALAPGRSAGLASPWGASIGTTIAAADWFGAASDYIGVTRYQAMQVPAVQAARNLICLPISQAVIKAFRNDVEIPAPVWAYRTDSGTPPQIRLLNTVDDLFFQGNALWWVDRTSSGAIGNAEYVDWDDWDTDPDRPGGVTICGVPAPAANVVFFTGWNLGLLYEGNKAIRHAMELADEVARRIRVPQAHTHINLSPDAAFQNDAEVQAFVDKYVADRRNQNGGVSVIPAGVTVDRGGEVPVSLYEQGRNAAALDIARLTGVPATMLDASGVAANLTYQTVQMSRSLLGDRIRERASIIEGFLSQDNVTPRGTRIALDLSALTVNDTGLPPAEED